MYRNKRFVSFEPLAFALTVLTLSTTSMAGGEDAGTAASGFSSIGPETPSDAPVLTTATGARSSATAAAYATAAATNGDEFFTTWYDSRGGIFGARLLGDGTVDPRDATGILLHATTVSVSPIVCSDGLNDVVVLWSETERLTTTLYAMKVDPSTGQPRSDADRAGIPLLSLTATNADLVVTLSSAVWDGSEIVVGWGDAQNSSWLGRVDVSSVPVLRDPDGIAVPYAVAEAFALSVGCAAQKCIVVGVVNAVEAAHFDAAEGRFTDTVTGSAADGFGGNASPIACDGTRCVIVWESSDDSEVEYAALGLSAGAKFGKVLAAAGDFSTALAWDGTNYVLSTDSGTLVFPKTFDSTGVGSPVAGSLLESTASGGAGVPLLSVTASDDEVFSLEFNSTTKTFSPANSTHLISQGPNLEVAPTFASGAAGTGLTWFDDRLSTSDPTSSAAYFGHFDPQSQQVIGTEFVLPQTGSGSLIDPSLRSGTLAAGPTSYLFAGTTGAGSLSLSRIAANGSYLTKSAVHPANAGQFSAGYGAGNYLVVTSSNELDVEAYDEASFTFWPASASPTLKLSSSGQEPAIAFSGSTFMVVWTQQQTPNLPVVMGARISSDYELLDTNPIAIQSDSFPASQPSVVWAHGEFLVVWRDLRDEFVTGDIYGTLVGEDGIVRTKDFAVVKAPKDQTEPIAADLGDGLNFLVAWQDARGADADIYGALVGYDGTARQADGGIPLSALPADELSPSLVSLASGGVVLEYSHAQGNDLTTPRLVSREIHGATLAGTCTANGDCASLHCADGVCCESACTGTCQSCAIVPGSCTTVTSHTDPDTCSGAQVCNASGACVDTNGQLCAKATDCQSGFCADGYCCDSACSGGCDVCNSSPGVCTVISAGSTGANPSCAPDLCDGVSHVCPGTCRSDTDCIRPYTCSLGGSCILASGAACSDDHTVKLPNGFLKDCSPYLCGATACATTCNSIEDCVAGKLCSADHECVPPSVISTSSGCATSGDDGRSEDIALMLLFVGGGVFGIARRKRRTN